MRKIISRFYEVEVNQLISPVNYSAHTGDVEQVQHYASVDERKCFKPGVAGERYKPVCNVDRSLCLLNSEHYFQLICVPVKQIRPLNASNIKLHQFVQL